jgi:hypothetical protein
MYMDLKIVLRAQKESVSTQAPVFLNEGATRKISLQQERRLGRIHSAKIYE